MLRSVGIMASAAIVLGLTIGIPLSLHVWRYNECRGVGHGMLYCLVLN